MPSGCAPGLPIWLIESPPGDTSSSPRTCSTGPGARRTWLLRDRWMSRLGRRSWPRRWAAYVPSPRGCPLRTPRRSSTRCVDRPDVRPPVAVVGYCMGARLGGARRGRSPGRRGRLRGIPRRRPGVGCAGQPPSRASPCSRRIPVRPCRPRPVDDAGRRRTARQRPRRRRADGDQQRVRRRESRVHHGRYAGLRRAPRPSGTSPNCGHFWTECGDQRSRGAVPPSLRERRERVCRAPDRARRRSRGRRPYGTDLPRSSRCPTR